MRGKNKLYFMPDIEKVMYYAQDPDLEFKKWGVYQAFVPFKEDIDNNLPEDEVRYKQRPVLYRRDSDDIDYFLCYTATSQTKYGRKAYIIKDMDAAGVYDESTLILWSLKKLKKDLVIEQIGTLADVDISEILDIECGL